jgi:branched-chain amino acid transport system substrate-binding protein
MNWKNIFGIMLIFLLACTQAPEQKYQIGGVFHLTGSTTFWGEGEKKGAMLAIDEINAQGGINGKQLEMIVEDGKTDFKETALAIQKLIDVDGVQIIVGPTWFGQVASPIANRTKKLIISPSSVVSPPSIYFLNLWPTERQEVTPVAQHMKKRNLNKIAVVYNHNDWSQSMKDNFVDEAQKQGLNIVKIFATNPDETDFKTILTQIKALDVDAVYAPFAFYPAQGALTKQLREFGLNVTFYSGSGTENPQLLEAYPAIEGTLYPYRVKGPQEETFNEKYRKKYNEEPSLSSAYAYDAVMLVAKALREGKTTPEDVSAYLHTVKDYEGASNTITFDENGGITQKEHVMKQIKDGKFVFVED